MGNPLGMLDGGHLKELTFVVRDQLSFEFCALNLLNVAEMYGRKNDGTSVSVVLHRQRPRFH